MYSNRMLSLSTICAREQLANGDLRALFIEELGWDRYTAEMEVRIDGFVAPLHALAQKRGMIAYQCSTPAGQRLPDYLQRRKIEHQVAKSAHEHLIVFTDAACDVQIWQWVKREPGKPVACREHTFHRTQPGDSLLQKLEAIAFSLDEEDRLSLVDVTRRTRAGFDVERVTKRFYDRFQKEHAAFLEFIAGISEAADRAWYASVLLNRLMFVYFIQRKGFLDDNRDYLRDRLVRMKAEHGKDKFYSFYRYFLLHLFHEGLGGKARTCDLERLLGKIPYLNGGLFDVHELEKPDRYGKTIQIPDRAFERVFDYFDQYQWHLDERPLRADNEINSDVLGYIFEKHINQKQMGAYYTKEDITDYISKNTVIPFLLGAVQSKCRSAFDNPDGPTVWDLLKDDPDRYIYPAVRHGNGESLPSEIAEGVNPQSLHTPVGDGSIRTLELRKGWNATAPTTHALPTETWREVIARRERYEWIKAKLNAGEIREINDLITLNLDIRQFAQDVVESSEGPELLRAFWHAIEKVSILDPTCGSGAFLFAALNILEPLYEACLDRMKAFVEDLARSDDEHRTENFSDFKKILNRVAAHPNQRYFIFRSIILNNLFGVDIMDEAVEICKLRLFLKLAGQVDPDSARDNLGIEPLPDIDFNIRAGNTLVGYATLEAVKQALSSKLDFDNAAEKIAAKAADLQQAFDAFRSRQIEGDESVPGEHKQELRRRLRALGDELNRHLAGEYSIEPTKRDALAKWLRSHQPFHWLVEFYGIMQSGGFDVIIGNPPYVEYRTIKNQYIIQGYDTECCGNLYAYVIERCYDTLRRNGRMGMIVQLPIVCTNRMKPLQKECLAQSSNVWFANFDDRPARLFDGLEHVRVTIFTSQKDAAADRFVFSTTYHRWYSESRPQLFESLSFSEISDYLMNSAIPKIGRALAKMVRKKIDSLTPLGENLSHAALSAPLFFHNAPQYWIRAMDFTPYFWNERDGEQISTQVKTLSLSNKTDAAVVVAVLNSSLFYWWFLILSDCRHLNMREVENFPLGLNTMPEEVRARLAELTPNLMADFRCHKMRKECTYQATGKVVYDEFYPKHSKPIIDEIDRVLAKHYGFTEEELDFIINYDLKYRMGSEAQGEDE